MIRKAHDPRDKRAWSIITGLLSAVALAASGHPDGTIGWISFSILATACLGSALVTFWFTRRVSDPLVEDDYRKARDLPRTLPRQLDESPLDRLERQFTPDDKGIVRIDSRR